MVASGSFEKRLRVALAFSAALLALDLIGGLVAHSLALLADAGHVLADLAGLSLSYLAVRLRKRTASMTHTYGLARAEILAAFVNAQILILACGLILFESYRRLTSPVRPVAPLMMAFGAAALIANIFAAKLLHPHQHEGLHARAAFLEVAADALNALAVVAGGAALALTGARWIDPAVSAAIALAILPRTVGLLRQSAHILLEGAPRDVDLAGLFTLIGNVPGVVSVHDIHLWTLTSNVHSASLHATIAADADRDTVRASLESALRERAAIRHTTIQLETASAPACDLNRDECAPAPDASGLEADSRQESPEIQLKPPSV